MSLPLTGVTVLDLTRVLAGPYVTMVLGDLGADVIKIERLPGGDDSRAMGPFRDGESYCFAQVNRNKRGIALDLKHPDGLKALLALAARSDVVVENFRPGTAERLGGNTQRMWQALCTQVLGRPDWASRPEYATAQDRLAHGDELERDIQSVLVTETTGHWVTAMLAAGVPAGPVNTYDQMIADPHLTARGITTTVEHPVLGPVRALNSPLRLSKTPPQIRRGAPVFGEHTAQVLGTLGYSAEDVSALQASGAVYDPAFPPSASPPPPRPPGGADA